MRRDRGNKLKAATGAPEQWVSAVPLSQDPPTPSLEIYTKETKRSIHTKAALLLMVATNRNNPQTTTDRQTSNR